MHSASYPIVDLHCDLLSYLQMNPVRSPFDDSSKTSYTQMKKGGIALQALAVFTLSQSGSGASGRQQIELFSHLLTNYPTHYCPFDPTESLEQVNDPRIRLVLALENAYALCEENEAIQVGLAFLDQIRKQFGHILYISLTWDGENRFGGGVGSSAGLKEDGQRVLDHLHEKKIAIDLSHTSDFLADDIINYIDRHSLKIPMIASHSNMRSITNRPRNLPDLIAKEIIHRQGIIGLNFFSPFIGQDHRYLIKHVDHALSLGGEKSLCFGADFFPDQDFPYIQKKYNLERGFFPEIDNASHYPYLLSLFRDELGLSPLQLQGICYQNFQEYLKRI